MNGMEHMAFWFCGRHEMDKEIDGQPAAYKDEI